MIHKHPNHMSSMLGEKAQSAYNANVELQMLKSDKYLRDQLADVLEDYFPPTIKDYSIYETKGYVVGFDVENVRFECRVIDSWSGARGIYVTHLQLLNFFGLKFTFKRHRWFCQGWMKADDVAGIYRASEKAREFKHILQQQRMNS